MNYPLMPHMNLIYKRQGRIINGFGKTKRKRRMRGGNMVSDLGKTALNIITSGNKKTAALNELKNWNSKLREAKTISNFLKNRNNSTLKTIGNLASMAGYGKRKRRRRMRGGNIVSTLGRAGLNIITSSNKKQAALNELKNLNSTLRQDKVISNFLKNKKGILGKIGSVAGLAGYGSTSRRSDRTAIGRRRTYRRRLRGRGFFGKIWNGIKSAGKFTANVVKKPISLAAKAVQLPVKMVMDTVGQPIINYGVSKLLGGRRRSTFRRRTYQPRRIYNTRRKYYLKRIYLPRRIYRPRKTYRPRRTYRQRGGFLLAPLIAGLVKRTGSTLINKGKEKLINYAKTQGENLLKKITGGRRIRRIRRKQKGGKRKTKRRY